MYEKKDHVFKSPDVTKLQAIVIDRNTVLYIALDADPEEARARYLARYSQKKI